MKDTSFGYSMGDIQVWGDQQSIAAITKALNDSALHQKQLLNEIKELKKELEAGIVGD